MRCRPVRIGSTTALIDADDPEVARRLDDLLAALPDGQADAWPGPDDQPRNPGTGSVVDVRALRVPPETGDESEVAHELWLGRWRVINSRQLWRIEDELLTNFNRWALDDDPDRLHLHAGLVARNGTGIVLVGASGSGKSTLTAHLVRQGWTYHSDEMVGFDPARPLEGRSYARPPSLKRGSWPLFADLPSVPDGQRTLKARDCAHIPPGELGDVHRSTTVAIGAVVLISYGTTGGVSDIGPAAAVERLTAETLDLARAGAAGVAVMVELANRTRVVCLDYDHLDAAAAGLDDLLSQPSPAERPVTVLPPGGRPLADDAEPISGASVLQRAPQVTSWLLDDGTVIYDPDSGLVARIDPSGGEVWRRFDGSRSVEQVTSELVPADVDPAAAIAGIVAFAEGLRSARLLGSPTTSA